MSFVSVCVLCGVLCVWCVVLSLCCDVCCCLFVFFAVWCCCALRCVWCTNSGRATQVRWVEMILFHLFLYLFFLLYFFSSFSDLGFLAISPEVEKVFLLQFVAFMNFHSSTLPTGFLFDAPHDFG